jgi:hypothetical protein
MTICRYCDKPVETPVVTHSYWGGLPFQCHAECKQAGQRQEAFDCQCIDADCNDCKHFKRGSLEERWLSCIENDVAAMKLVNMGFFHGHCLKFDRPTEANPKKWTGRECFEHRRA